MRSGIVQTLRQGDLVRVGPVTIECTRVVEGKTLVLVIVGAGVKEVGTFAVGDSVAAGELELRVQGIQPGRCTLRIVAPCAWAIARTKREERKSHVNYQAGMH